MEAQKTYVTGTKNPASIADDDNEMVEAEEPRAKQPCQIKQPRRNRFSLNNQAVSNNAIGIGHLPPSGMLTE